MEEAWARAWQPMVGAVGTDFAAGVGEAGPDRVDAGAIRKLAEPLELDCPLHHDRELAVRLGYRDIPVPVSGIVPFTIVPVWQPGAAPVFTEADRNAQPARTRSGPQHTGLEPPVSAFFAADSSAEYLAPVVAGDRLTRQGNKL